MRPTGTAMTYYQHNILSELTKACLCWILVSSAPALAQGAPIPTTQPIHVQAEKPQAQTIKGAPTGSCLILPPVLESGRHAWLSVQGPGGKALPETTVLINGAVHVTDAEGELSFLVPNAAPVVFTLPSSNGGAAEKINYALTRGGLMMPDTEVSPLVERLLSTAGDDRFPRICYAPVVVEPAAELPIIGRNFCALPHQDRVSLSGYHCNVLAASTVSILAMVPDRISKGPLKQVLVDVKDKGGSNPVEVDVAAAELVLSSSSSGAQSLDGKIMAVGTNAPALIQMRNMKPDSTSISTKDGTKLGEHALLIAPGGDENFVPLTIELSETGAKPEIRCVLVPDVPEFAGKNVDDHLVGQLNRAQLVRLQRRLLALQNRLAEKKRSVGLAPSFDDDKVNAEIVALSVRQEALSSMVAARRSILEGAGAGTDEVQKALDDAAGGAYYVFEKSTRPVAFSPVSPVVKPIAAVGSNLSGAVEVSMAGPRRKRYIGLTEPRIKLLLPREEDPVARVPEPSTGEVTKTSAAGGMPPANSQPSASKQVIPGATTQSAKEATAQKPAAQKPASAKAKASPKTAASSAKSVVSRATKRGVKRHSTHSISRGKHRRRRH